MNINKMTFLCRAKRYDNNNWEYGSSIYLDETCIYLCPPYEYASSLSPLELIHYSSILIKPETIGRFTGIYDANEKPIFEGDVIDLGNFHNRFMYVQWNEETLAWELTDIGVRPNEVNHLINTIDLAELNVELAYGEMRSTIVGNIYDNTEYAIPNVSEGHTADEF